METLTKDLKKKTVVLGASTNPTRYSNIAVKRLLGAGHEVVPIGIKDGEIAGLEIVKDRPDLEDVHTITMYLSPENQAEYYDYIVSLKPKRILVNPGAENLDLLSIARDNGIELEFACTLVLLSSEQY